MTVSAPNTMKAVVIGGGIGGLAAGIALRNEGWEVVIYEKAATLEAGLGHGIVIGANGLKLLEAWEIDTSELRGTPFTQERVFEEATGQVVLEFKHDYYEAETGYPWLALRRTRLYEALLGGAKRTPKDKIPIQIITSQSVEISDPDNGVVKTENGREVTADVIIAADGVYSKSIYTIDPEAPPLIGATTAFRMEYDLERLQKDEVLDKIWRNEGHGFVLFAMKDHASTCLIIPETDGSLFGLFLHPYIEPKHGSEGRWDAEVSMAELVDFTQDASGAMKRLVPLAKELVRWTISIREPVHHFNRGKAVAIGDAAHPHLPNHGQGATAAMEDAASLAKFLSTTKLNDSVEERLQKWNEFRYARACTIQALSINGMNPLEKVIDKIRVTIGYKGPLPENVNVHQRPVQLWILNYDVRKEAEAFIDRKLSV